LLGIVRGQVLAMMALMTTTSAERQRTIALHDRVFQFSCGVLQACPHSISHLASREIWRQLVRAAPSALNNLTEADEASSTADFIAKMKIALREAKEARVCLRLLIHCKLTNYESLDSLEDESRQISSILASILIKVRARYSAQRRTKRHGSVSQL